MYNSWLIFSNFFSEHRQGRGIQDDKPVRGPLLHHIVQYVSSGHCTLGFHMGKPPSHRNKAHWGIVREREGTFGWGQAVSSCAICSQRRLMFEIIGHYNTYCCDWSDQWKKRRESGPQILFLKIHHICATQVPLPTKWDLIDQLMEAKPPNTCPAVSCTTINTGPWLVIWWMNELKLSPWIWVENRSLHWCCSDTGR